MEDWAAMASAFSRPTWAAPAVLLSSCLALLLACGSESSGLPGADSGGGSSGGATAGSGGAPPSGGTSSSGSGGEPNQATGGTSSGGSSSSGGESASGGSGGQAPSGGASSGSGGSQDPGAGGSASGGSQSVEPGPELTTISWGTTLQPPDVVSSARDLASQLVDPNAPNYRAKGDQRRTYRFEAAGRDLPYRLSVPSSWDGSSPLPLVMFLHGAGNDESSYVDANDKQMVKLAEEHGYVLVSPLGADGAYGSYLRLPAVFGEPAEADKLVSAKTPQTEHTQEVSERDVINVLELVLAEYPIDRAAVFLTGHSMGSGGTWYIGGKYSFYFRAIAPMSGPFIQESVYPWERMMKVPMFVTEGIDTPSLTGSRALRDWLQQNGYPSEYKEVQADHAGMVPLVLPDVFDFFDRKR